MARPLPALNDENAAFCRQVGEFCERRCISVRKFAAMCDGGRHRFSATTAYRLINAKDVDDSVIDRMRPVIAAAFATFLEELGLTVSEIEAELSQIFDTEEFLNMIGNRCELTPEAIRFLGLTHDPFDVDHIPGEDEVFTNTAIDAVAGRVRDAILYQRFIAIIGGVGTGKTLLKQRVAAEMEADGKARLLYPEFWEMEELTVSNIATAMLADLGQNPKRDKSQRVTQLKVTLTQLQQEGIAVCLVIDEAHRLQDRVLSSLKNFWEMTNGRSSRLLGVVLFGQPAFVEARLRDVKFKEIRERVQIVQMPHMNGSSAAYIAHRLSIAGSTIDRLFDPKAIERITQAAKTPLTLGNLCNEAMMEAFHKEETRVSIGFDLFKKLGQQVLARRRSAV